MRSPSQSPLVFENTLQFRLVSSFLLLWFLAFLYPHIVITDILVRIKAASSSTSQGDSYNQVLICSFAFLGLMHLPGTGRLLRVVEVRKLLILLGAYLGWCATTILWSADPSLSVRRLISLALIIVGSMGLGAGFYGRVQNGVALLAKHVIYSALICVLLLSVRILSGTQDISDPQWTLKYTTQIETYAFPLGYGVLATIYVYRNQPLRKLIVAGLYLVVLIALKGRTLILDVLAAAGIVYSRLTPVRTLGATTMAVSCLGTAVLLDLVTGGQTLIAFVLSEYDDIAPWIPYISIGDGLRNILQLSGRIPLWKTLLPLAADTPFLGHGFGAFWTPDRFHEIYVSIKWYAVVAHNGFLDEILATGLIGLIILLTFWIYGMYLAWRLGGSGYVLFGWLLLFVYFNTMVSIIQSYYQYPTFVSFIALGLLTSEYAIRKCDNCGAHLVEELATEGELVLCHP